MLKNTTLVYFGLNAIFCIGTKTIICGDQNTISHVGSSQFFVAHSSTVKTDNEQFLMFKNTTLVYFGSNAIFHIGTNTIICICVGIFLLDRYNSLRAVTTPWRARVRPATGQVIFLFTFFFHHHHHHHTIITIIIIHYEYHYSLYEYHCFHHPHHHIAPLLQLRNHTHPLNH